MASQSFYTLMDRVPDTVAWKDRTGLDVTSAGTASNMYVQQDASGAGYYTVNKKAGVSTDWRGLYSSTNYYASRNVAGIYMSFVVSSLTGESVFGLMNTDPAASFGDSAAGAVAPDGIAALTFGCWLQSSGVVKLVQNGTYATNLGTVQVGDRIVIECRGPSQGFVHALRNGQIVLTSSITPSASASTYYPCLSFKGTGVTIPVTNLSFGKFTSPMSIPSTVTWVDPSGAYTVAGSGTYTIGRSAVSVPAGFTRALYSTANGYNGFDDSAGFFMSCNMTTTANNQFYFGFAPTPNTNATKINDISYGAFINSTGSIVSKIVNGTTSGSIGTWSSGYVDTITVAYYNNYFTIFKTGDLNGNIIILDTLYAPASASVKYYPFFVTNDAAGTANITDTFVFGRYGESRIRIPQTITWTKVVGSGVTLDVSGTNNVYTITRGGTAGTWNTLAYSDISYTNNFYLKFRSLDTITTNYPYYQGGLTKLAAPTAQASMSNGIQDQVGPGINNVCLWEYGQSFIMRNNTASNTYSDMVVVPNTVYELQCISGAIFTYANGYLRRTSPVTTGSSYRALFLLSASRSVGDIEFGTFSTAAATAPGVPTGVSGTAGNGSVTVSFSPPASNGGSAITGYTVKAYAGGSYTGISATGGSSPITVTGLTNGTAYTFTVLATNAVGNSAESTASAAITLGTVPGSPTGVSATAGSSQATVTWTAPASNGGSALTKYTVTPSSGAAVDVSANLTTATLTGLTPGTSYTFTVTAVNTTGSSVASTASSAVIPYTTPGVPTGVSATAGNAEATVSWTAITNNSAVAGYTTITGYTITPSSGAPVDVSANITSKTITGLTNGTAYTFTVKASNAAGTGVASTATAAVTPYTVPGAVTGLSASSITTSGLTLSWTAPASNGGSTLTKYTVSYGSTSVDLSANVTSRAFTGLSVGTDYTFSIVAVNAAGSSSAATLSATTLKTVNTSVYNAHSVNSITYDLSSNFSIPTSGNTVRDAATNAVVSASVSGNQLTVTGLTEYTTYTFYVDLSGFDRFTTTSARTKDETAPGIVTGFTATPGNGQIELTWNELVQDAGSAIIGYYIYEGVSGNTVLRTVNPLSDTTETFTGLTNGTAYTYRIAAYDTDGNVGNTSTAFATPRTVPDAPTGVAGTPGNGQVSVSFTAPVNTGGSAISGYTVTASDGTTATGTASPITVTGLTNGTAYTFTVVASNAAGDSAASSVSAAVTPRTVPDAPTGLSGTPGNGQVVVSFTAPSSNGGAAISSYTVKAYAAGVYTDISASSTASPITVSGLTNGTAYTFTVAATNAAGAGAESTASAAVTPRAVPGAPTIGTATYGNAQATVTFTAPASTGGSAITKYTVTSNPGSIAVDVSANATSATVTGLTNGTSYTFTVTATNAAGTSAASSASVAVIPRTVPDAPTGVSAGAGNAQATVSFTAPASNGGSVVTGYTVTSSPGGLIAIGVSSPVTVTGLTNGTAYTFTVTAANDVGSSAASAASSSVTPMDIPTLSASVNENTITLLASSVIGATSYRFTTGSTVTDISDTKLVRDVSAGSYTYTVRAVSSTGVVGSASSAVTVVVLDKPAAVSASVNGAAVDVSFGTVVGATSYNIYNAGKLAATGVTASPYQFTGLTPGPYTYTVRAVNASGIGPSSVATTTVRVLETPTVAATVNGTTITVTVSTNAAATTYALYDGAGADVSSGSSNVFTFANQGAGSYTFRAKTATASGYSEASAAVTVAVLGAPTDVSASVAGTLITLTGSSVAGATRYMLCDANGDSIKDLSSNTPSFLVAGKVQQTYTLGMRAVNESGQGPLSATATLAVYDAPSSVSADVSGDTVRVAFDAVTGISSYALVNTATGAQVATGATSPFTLASQAAGTYSYGVRVLGDKLVGVTSNSVSVTVLAAPANVTATESTDASGFKSITVIFDAVTGATGYKLYDASSNDLLAEGASASFVRANVTAGSYSYYVRAVNASGTGPASSATAAITIAPPNPPTDVAATSTDITWVAPATGLVTGYKVYTVVNGAYTFFKSVDASTTSLAKSSLLPSSDPITYVVTTAAPTGESAYSATSATFAVSFNDVPTASVPLDAFLSTSLNATAVDASTLKETLQANVSKFESPVVTIPDLDIGKLVAADTPQSVKDSLASLPVNVILHDPASTTPVAVSSESITPGSAVYFPSSEGQTWPMDFGGVIYKMVFGIAGAVTILDASDAVIGTYNIGDEITLNGRSFVYAASGSMTLNTNLPLATNISGSVDGTKLTVAFTGTSDYTYFSTTITYRYALYSLSNDPSSDMGAEQTSSNSLTLSNLTSGQQYNVYVTTICTTTARKPRGGYTTTTTYRSVSTPLTVTVLPKPTLSATVDRQTVTLTVGTVAGATDYIIYDGANVVTPASVSGSVYTLTNVAPAVHSYTVRAVAAATVSSPSDAVSVTVLAAPTITAVSVDGTVAFITFADVSNATSYKLCTAAGTPISNVALFSNSFVVPNLSVGTYSYTVRGVYQGSLGPLSNVGSAVVLAAPASASASVNGSTITISFPVVSGAAGYKLYESGTEVTGATLSTTRSIMRDITPDATYTVSDVSVGTYNYTVSATSTNTVSSPSPSTGTVSVVAAPVLSGYASGSSAVLSWTVSGTFAGYIVYNAADDTVVATVATASYTDTSLAAGSHSYYVRAYNGSDLGIASNVVTVYALAAPANVSATVSSATSAAATVAVSFSAVTDASGYEVIQSEIASTVGTSSPISVTSVAAGTYTYYLRATRDTNIGAVAPFTFTVLAAPSITSVSATGNQVTVSFGAVAGATAYRVYSASGVTKASGSATSLSFTETASGSYTYYVRAYTASGGYGLRSASSNPVTVTIGAPPPPPPPSDGSGATVPCFFANAPVLTPTGYQKISHLAVGELVVTGDGRHVPVQRVKVTRVAAGPNTNPYVIQRGQFGAVRRLLISPNHKVITADGPVEAKDLNLRQEEHDGTLTYYNIELPDHARDTMVVAGVVVESLAPVRRVVVTMPQFVALMARKYGTEVTPQMLANVERTCRLLPDGRVEVPVLRR